MKKKIGDLTLTDIVDICINQFDKEAPGQRYCPACPLGEVCWKTINDVKDIEIEFEYISPMNRCIPPLIKTGIDLGVLKNKTEVEE